MKSLTPQLRVATLALVFGGILVTNLAQIRLFPFVAYGMFTRKIDADRAGALVPLVELADGKKLIWIQPRQLAPYRLAYQDPQLWHWLESGQRDRVQERLRIWAAKAERESGREVRSISLLKVSGLVDAQGDLQIDVPSLESRGELAFIWRAP